MSKLRVFVASPGDVKEERDLVSYVVEELSRSMGHFIPITLEAVRWETHAWPDVGSDAQDVINKEVGEYDVFIGIMWKRFGSPTKRASSGTEEEFARAYELFREYGRPKIMFYFKTASFYTTNEERLSQFAKVVAFRRSLEKLGVLFWEFSDPLKFERRVREHLIRQIGRLTRKARPKRPPQMEATDITRPSPRIFISYARDDLEKAESVYNLLKSAGFEPWLDVKDIVPGSNWKDSVRRSIQRADLFIACLSRRSVQKRGFVQMELRLGLQVLSEHLDSKIFIIPLRLEECEVPESFSRLHYLDFFQKGGPEKLVSAVRAASRGLGTGSESAAEEPRDS